MEREKKREHTFKYVFCVHICVLYEGALELCNICKEIYFGRKVCMHRLLMEQKGHAEKLLGNARKFMPWTLCHKSALLTSCK